MALQNKRELGQNWLKDRGVLAQIAECAELTEQDVVLEIGPGLGTLTSVLLKHAASVTAVEFDTDLARKLPGQFPGTRLTVVNKDILHFDLGTLPAGYKVVANVPYYITSKIIETLMTAANKPSLVVILVQKEVAERVAAREGDMSILALSAQIFADVTLGPVIGREWFTPPPKVDSQVIIMKTLATPLVAPEDEKAFFRVIKAGFSSKRKKLRSSLSGGLGLSKQATLELLTHASIDPDKRAEDLTIAEWQRLARDAV